MKKRLLWQLLKQKKLVHAKFASILLYEEGHLGNAYKAFSTNKPVVVKTKQISKIYPQFLDHGVKSIVYVPLSHKNTRHFSQTQKALETRDAFISMASHELKTPLTSIIGYVQLIKSKLKAGVDFNHNWIEEIDIEAQKLSRLINEFLQTDYIRKSEIKHQDKGYSLSGIISHAVIAYNFRAGQHKIRFQHKYNSSQDIISCDKDKLLTGLITLFSLVEKNNSSDEKIFVTQKGDERDWVINLKWPKKSLAQMNTNNKKGRQAIPF